MPEKYTTLFDVLSGWVGPAMAGLIVTGFARLMWHSNEARKGHRRFFGPELFWELPVAIGMVFIGEGLAAWLNLQQPVSSGLIAILAYLGPRGIEATLLKLIEKMLLK